MQRQENGCEYVEMNESAKEKWNKETCGINHVCV